jgi:hypothetical protein
MNKEGKKGLKMARKKYEKPVEKQQEELRKA